MVFSPSSPARIAATYPPGPLPIIATSYLATLLSFGAPRTAKLRRACDACLFCRATFVAQTYSLKFAVVVAS